MIIRREKPMRQVSKEEQKDMIGLKATTKKEDKEMKPIYQEGAIVDLMEDSDQSSATQRSTRRKNTSFEEQAKL